MKLELCIIQMRGKGALMYFWVDQYGTTVMKNAGFEVIPSICYLSVYSFCFPWWDQARRTKKTTHPWKFYKFLQSIFPIEVISTKCLSLVLEIKSWSAPFQMIKIPLKSFHATMPLLSLRQLLCVQKGHASSLLHKHSSSAESFNGTN